MGALDHVRAQHVAAFGEPLLLPLGPISDRSIQAGGLLSSAPERRTQT